MAGFINTTYNDSIKSVLQTQMDIIKNPHYKWTDKNPTPVTYYNINQAKSTLDQGSQLAYDSVGSESPLRFNKIENMILYGIDSPMAITFDNDEFGLKTQDIEGEAIVLPDTIIPTPDDRFVITYLKEKLTFKVTHVDNDTLEDGSNIYRLQYRSSVMDGDKLENQVVEDFHFIADHAGTQFNPIIRSNVIDFIEMINNEILALKGYYKSIFYNSRVQAFTFKFLEDYFYDPYFTEFIRRNKLMNGDDEYIYICHQTPLDPLFPIQYNKTFYRALENKDKSAINGINIKSVGKLIQYPYSTFANRYEDYYEIDYTLPIIEPVRPIACFREEIRRHIVEGRVFEEKYLFYNIIIKYFNDMDITEDDIKSIEKIDYENNPTLFYAIPTIIFCLQRIVLSFITKNDNPET